MIGVLMTAGGTTAIVVVSVVGALLGYDLDQMAPLLMPLLVVVAVGAVLLMVGMVKTTSRLKVDLRALGTGGSLPPQSQVGPSIVFKQCDGCELGFEHAHVVRVVDEQGNVVEELQP